MNASRALPHEPTTPCSIIRLYSARDVERLKRIKSLTDDLGVNLAGVEVIIRLLQQISKMEQAVQGLTDELDNLKAVKQG